MRFLVLVTGREHPASGMSLSWIEDPTCIVGFSRRVLWQLWKNLQQTSYVTHLLADFLAQSIYG
jgi:hypothetical protein